MSKAPSDEKQLVRDPVGTAPNTATSRRLRKYMCDACEGALPEGGSFVSVIDAIQGDGFHPLWQEVQLTFNAHLRRRRAGRRHRRGDHVDAHPTRCIVARWWDRSTHDEAGGGERVA
jgi:hypothetical protein